MSDSHEPPAMGGQDENAAGKAGEGGDRRDRLQQRLGQLVLAMLRQGRHADRPIADLTRIALDPLLSDRVAFATGPEGEGDLRAIAIWASVDDAVHNRIADAAKTGTFPALARADWRSGETIWLLDILAPNAKDATAAFMAFTQLANGRQFRLHPTALGMLDPGLIARFRDAVAGLASTAEAPEPLSGVTTQ